MRPVYSAARDLAPGEEVTMTLGVELFLSTEARQRMLLQDRGLKCRCSRCKDPSEMGLPPGAFCCYSCRGEEQGQEQEQARASEAAS